MILQPTEGFARCLLQELRSRSHPVRCPDHRSRDDWRELEDLPVARTDLTEEIEVYQAAEGCQVIVQTLSAGWAVQIPRVVQITRNSLSAARAAGATLPVGGAVYGQANRKEPQSPLARLQVELEQSLELAAQSPGLQVLLLHTGHCFGPAARNVLADGIFKNGVQGKALRFSGGLDAACQWIFLPDLTRAAADLLERRAELESFEVFPFEGYTIARRSDFLRRVADLAGRPDLAARPFQKWTLRLREVFSREAAAARLWLEQEPPLLDGSRRRARLPAFSETPLAEAVRMTLEDYRKRK